MTSYMNFKGSDSFYIVIGSLSDRYRVHCDRGHAHAQKSGIFLIQVLILARSNGSFLMPYKYAVHTSYANEFFKTDSQIFMFWSNENKSCMRVDES